jgi:hypothetical protein
MRVGMATHPETHAAPVLVRPAVAESDPTGQGDDFPQGQTKGWCDVITVPLWVFATLCGVAGLALLGLAAALARAQRTVDRILADELGPRPDGDLTPPTNRQANRGHQHQKD